MDGQSSSQGRSIKDDLAGIVRVDDTLSNAVRKLKVINLSSWRVLKRTRQDYVRNIELRGYKR